MGIALLSGLAAVLATLSPLAPAKAFADGMRAPTADADSDADRAQGVVVASLALQYAGYRYAWGGDTPAGFDCSGFTYYVLQKVGAPMPRDHWGQLNAGPRVDRSQLEPGDLVFFSNTYMAGLSHSGVYLGNDQFIHAGIPSTGVTVSSLADPYWATRWFGATRVR